MAKSYKEMFAEALMAQQNQQDPLQKQYEAEVMKKNEAANMAPTMGLIDHFTGSNLSASVPKNETTQDKLAKLLQLRQGAQGQRLKGLQALAGMEADDASKAQERAFKEKMFELQAMKARAGLNKGAKLGAEDKKALGYTQSLQRDLQAYKEAVKSGGLRPELWSKMAGDTPTMALRKALVENYGRLQSGGAISGDEEARFGALFGSMMDSPDVLEQKLKRIEEEIASKNALYGGGAYAPAPGRAPSAAPRASGNVSELDPDSMSEAELDAALALYGAQ